MRGTIYKNGNRYWWKVKLPGSSRVKQIPLKPVGAKYATKDKGVAREVAKMIWQDALSDNAGEDIKTISELIAAYHNHCKTYYRNKKERFNIQYATGFLEENTEVKYAQDFKALALIKLRDAVVETGKWTRSTINKRISIIKRMFKWAASREIVPITTYQSLLTVEGLKRNRTKAKEGKPVKPVPEKVVYETLPYMSTVGQAMV